MRILMTTDAVGGVWQYSMELIRQLGRFGCEVVVASFGAPLRETERREIGELPHAQLQESQYRLEWMEHPWLDVERAAAWLESLLRDTRCDLLHFNCFGPVAARNWDVPVLLVAHSCVYSWWRAVHGTDPGPEWRRYRDNVSAALSRADRIVAPSAAMLQALVDCYGDAQCRGRAHVVHNGVDGKRWPAGAADRGKPFVFGAGRVWDPAKNLSRLAAAAGRLDCPVVIAGDYTVNDVLVKSAQGKAGPGGQIRRHAVLLGRLSRSRLAEYYRTAAVFAHPARYEPFGLAVLEAALSGSPLVLGDIASLRELWDGAALFVDPTDGAALHAALQGLLDDPQERRRRGEAARTRALRYSAHSMASAYLEHYRSLTSIPVIAEGVA